MDINPELQKVIDQVTKYATTPIGGAMGQTAAQGRALLGVGELAKDIQTTGMDIASKEKMAAGTLAGEAEKTKLLGGFEEKRLGIEQQKVDVTKAAIPAYLQGMITSGMGVGGNKPVGGSTIKQEIYDYLDQLRKF